MGIHSLSKVIAEHAAGAIKEFEMKNLFGTKVAVDASMSLYQFLIAVRQDGNVLTNAQGETTSHLVGLFYRTIRMVEHGIKPVYVFDGKPPTLKRGELNKRTERREEAQASLERAREDGNAEEEIKLSKRLVKVTAQHNAEAKQLLRLMGIPVLDAPGEAEAQCAVLTNSGRVFATATDDMDALCFGTRVLVRHLCASEARKLPIQEFRLEKVLSAMDMSFDSFIDMCILLGCDYCDTIRGVGPKTAYELISKHKRIEDVLAHLSDAKPKTKSKAKAQSEGEASRKYAVPENFPFEEVRELFRKPLVCNAEDIPEFRWEVPDEEGLVEMLVRRFGFAEDRVRNASRKLAKLNRSAQQSRIDNFFGQPSAATSSKEVKKDPKLDTSGSDSEIRVAAKKRRIASSSSESDKDEKEAKKSQKKEDDDAKPRSGKVELEAGKDVNENANKRKTRSPSPKQQKDVKVSPKKASTATNASDSSTVDEKREEKPRKTVNAFELMFKSTARK